MFLAGDLGGTKTLLGEFEATNSGLRQVRQQVFPSQSYPTFDGILAEFLSGRTGLPFRSACFGVAGTVINGRCKTTNLPWLLEERALAVAIGVARVKLFNDLETTAYGMITLPPTEMAVLKPASAPKDGPSPPPGRAGNIAVIAAGTGLGEAMLYWDGTQHHPIASEGGHADFGPRTDREIALLQYLRKKLGSYVSYERVLSGPGFLNIYSFLRDEGYFAEPACLAEQILAGNPNAVIAEHGLAGDDPLCAETVAMFAAAYGAEAANLALRFVATGGVFLGGGIAPKLLPALRSPAFLEAFVDKGRFSPFLDAIEVSVALNPEASLLGAAHYAGRL